MNEDNFLLPNTTYTLDLKSEETQKMIKAVCDSDRKPRIREQNIDKVIHVSAQGHLCGYEAFAACLKEYMMRLPAEKQAQNPINVATGANVRRAMLATWEKDKDKYQLCFTQKEMDTMERSLTDNKKTLEREYWFDSVVAAQVAADTVGRVVMMVIGDQDTTTTYPLFKKFINPHKQYPIIMYLKDEIYYQAVVLKNPIRVATDIANSSIIFSRARDVAPHADLGALMAVYLEMYTPDFDEDD